MWNNGGYNNNQNFNNNNGYGYNNNGYGNNNNNNRGWNDSTTGANLQTIDWAKESLAPFQKVFYKESSRERSQEEYDEFYRKNSITAKTPHGRMPNPFLSWDDAHFPQYVMEEVNHAKFDKPSPIQALAFPVVLSGHDLIGIAETGSGKTLSFLLPAIVHINAQSAVKRGDGPIALVLAPTRELAMQIEKESQKFGYTSKLRCACIYGGADKYSQRNQLYSGVDLVIATPGRLIDFLETNTTNLKRVTYLVLDEADRMLDMGFEIQIRKILSQIRPDRQTLMFSATWPRNVQNLAHDYIRNEPVHIQIGKHELAINDRIKQIVYVTDMSKKTNLCIKQLDMLTQKDKVLIFSQTKKGCENICRVLNREGFKCMSIHGDKVQKDRDYVMEKFKSSECKVLVATDVASRGLDVKDVTHVINYDFPKVLEDYVHRIGRTGRAGAYGCSVSFVTYEDDRKISREFVQMLVDAKQEIPDDLLNLAGINTRYRQQYRPIGASYYDIKKFGEKVSASSSVNYNGNTNNNYANGSTNTNNYANGSANSNNYNNNYNNNATSNLSTNNFNSYNNNNNAVDDKSKRKDEEKSRDRSSNRDSKRRSRSRSNGKKDNKYSSANDFSKSSNDYKSQSNGYSTGNFGNNSTTPSQQNGFPPQAVQNYMYQMQQNQYQQSYANGFFNNTQASNGFNQNGNDVPNSNGN